MFGRAVEDDDYIFKGKTMASALLNFSKSKTLQAPRSGAMLTVLALLAFSVFINYIDRGNLSIAAPLIKDELRLSGSQLGILLSSFFWTYGLFQILSGWLVDRFHVGWVMAVGFFLWSAATSATGLLHSFTALLLVRVVLGIGESVAYPSYSKILAKYIPHARRGAHDRDLLFDSAGLCLCRPGDRV